LRQGVFANLVDYGRAMQSDGIGHRALDRTWTTRENDPHAVLVDGMPCDSGVALR
jgi:hypothetical protein